MQNFGAVKKFEIMLLKDPLGMYHSLSFAEDDKLRPGQDVTSTSQGQKFQMCKSMWPT